MTIGIRAMFCIMPSRLGRSFRGKVADSEQDAVLIQSFAQHNRFSLPLNDEATGKDGETFGPNNGNNDGGNSKN